MTIRCHLFPEHDHDVARAIVEGGGEVVAIEKAQALIHTGGGPDRLAVLLKQNPDIEWVQLRGAGIDRFVPTLDTKRLWTSAKGAYSQPVAEHALALALAGMRGAIRYGRQHAWSEPYGHSLHGSDVVILGGGGITRHLLTLLQPFGANVTVVRRRHEPLPGAKVVSLADLEASVATADLVVLALALTDETQGIVDAGLLSAMSPNAWLVNVARGAHIVTDDLVAALEGGEIGGAALDVTDPEPLPEGHRLWQLENALITPHVGSTPEMHLPFYLHRVKENLRRFAAGEDLIGVVDVELGY